MIPNKLKTLSRSKASCPLGSSAARGIQTSWRTLGVIVLLLVLAATTSMLAHFFDAHLHGGQILERLPYPAIPRRLVENMTATMVRNNFGLLSVRDIVGFPDELMLMIAVVDGAYLPSKYEIECLFGRKDKTAVVSSEWKDDLHSILAVRCKYPPEPQLESQEATVLVKDSNIIIPSRAQYVANSSWIPLAYETLTLADSVLLFVKGLLDRRGKPCNYSTSLHELSCCFGAYSKTAVIGVAQEVVRCELPSRNQIHQLQGTVISLAVPHMGILPSVAYFDSNPRHHQSIARPTRKMFYICSCTMLWNEAQFLREWVLYHGFLGIERWFLYDNNSEDNVEEVLAGLQALKHNVTRHAWPWIKTQEAAFSHCALRARADCEWVLFTDVDEFVYPVKEMDILSQTRDSSYSTWQQAENSPSHVVIEPQANGPSPNLLRRLIQDTLQKGAALGKNIGEVRLKCHNFGPSGLVHTPEEGVMLGYTCRMKHPQRHKSFILLKAMSDSLQNVVHHFSLREGYDEMAVQTPIAVINHYKFQAWEVFKSKFVRRAATYVVDWQDQTAQTNDRAPGLGPEAVEPADWPTRYCEEEDLGLRNFVWNFLKHPQTLRLPWQSSRLKKVIPALLS